MFLIDIFLVRKNVYVSWERQRSQAAFRAKLTPEVRQFFLGCTQTLKTRESTLTRDMAKANKVWGTSLKLCYYPSQTYFLVDFKEISSTHLGKSGGAIAPIPLVAMPLTLTTLALILHVGVHLKCKDQKSMH